MRDLWKDVDQWAAKSKAEYQRAEEALSRMPGWKFNGCPDGVIWEAQYPREKIKCTARTVDELLSKVTKEQDGVEKRAKAYAESEAARKTRGER